MKTEGWSGVCGWAEMLLDMESRVWQRGVGQKHGPESHHPMG